VNQAVVPQTFRVFAYGSNMLTRRLQARTPSARAVGVATLPGHGLHWHKRGQDGSGKCDVVADPQPSKVVHGVLYDIALVDKPALDRAEGLGAGYELREVQLQTSVGSTTAWLYFATHIEAGLRPFSWYKALVVAGARQFALSAAYVQTLEMVATTEDPDRERHAANMGLLGAP
jgi:gamma-glutamylcyclotransferase